MRNGASEVVPILSENRPRFSWMFFMGAQLDFLRLSDMTAI